MPIDLHELARRFPLVPRPRPALPPLQEQLAEISTLARTPPEHPAAGARIAAAHNRAALVASNCGEPGLARTLCWQHHHRYAARQPWTAREARFAIEPLVNLARLRSRAHQPDLAIQILEALLTATTFSGIADVEGHPIDLGGTIATPDDRNTLRRWVWTVTLTEGLRALARTGRWEDAVTHAERHRGLGATLLDGCQISVLAHALRGDHLSATSRLTETVLAEPWQSSVAQILRLFISHCAETSIHAESGAYFAPGRLDRQSYPTEAFGVEVQLAVIHLADGAIRSATLRDLTDTAAAITDADLARTILTHPARCRLPGWLLDQLTRAGLEDTPPGDQLRALLDAALAA